MIDINFLKRHNKFNQSLLNTVLSQEHTLVKNNGTAEAKKIYKMSREVTLELHRLKSFIRLDFSKPNILHAEIKATHKIEDLLINFFLERFPTMIIIIQSNKGCFSKEIDSLFTKHGTDLKQTIKMKQDKNFNDKSINYDYLDEFKDEYWTEFYDNQTISTRKNKDLFSKVLPKKIRHIKGLSEERKAFSESKQLNEFI